MKATERPFILTSLQEKGIAAIEFSLIAALMAMMLVGSLIYWRTLQAQQSITRAAGDGARIVQNLIYGTLPGYDVTKASEIGNLSSAATTVVQQSLQGSGIPGNPLQDTTVTLTPGSGEVHLNVAYRLPPLFGNSNGQPKPVTFGSWSLTEPASLKATAVVSFE